MHSKENRDERVIDGFGDEWSRFDQRVLSEAELQVMFESYFQIFPWSELPPDATGFDAGCGSGRWARLVAPRVGRLICVDASEAAAAVAQENLSALPNCEVHTASISAMPIPDESADFGYSLGVLHHIPDTAAGIKSCVRKLKAGGVFLVYLYYAFDNRPPWFRLLWSATEPVRAMVSRAPHPLRFAVSQVIATFVYWPLARTARLLERLGLSVDGLPLSYYRNRTFYVMRTDALDRFGTRLEKRFNRAEIATMMGEAGLTDVRFSESAPFWCAVGKKPSTSGTPAA
ncbi:MAG TPA: class I SAM-dependent methyltransferase [Thermoanaerobaculia bacterium]|nr:class I SAM-dependent methyltransferase [Thermoanaerobaculia bacterium]